MRYYNNSEKECELFIGYGREIKQLAKSMLRHERKCWFRNKSCYLASEYRFLPALKDFTVYGVIIYNGKDWSILGPSKVAEEICGLNEGSDF